jgi:hypothetical protein
MAHNAPLTALRAAWCQVPIAIRKRALAGFAAVQHSRPLRLIGAAWKCIHAHATCDQ